MAKSQDIGVDWNLFSLDQLEAHLRSIRAVNVTPSSKFMAVLRQKRREARSS